MGMITFDFDQWADLARTDMVEFDQRRMALMNDACENLGGKDQPHLAAMLWRIEAERGLTHADEPLYQRLFTLMWRRYLDLESTMCKAMVGMPIRRFDEHQVLPMGQTARGLSHGRDGS